jgi:hypothetical protein
VSGDPFGTKDSESIPIDGGPEDPLFIVGRRLDTERGSVRLGFDKQFSTLWSVQFFASYAASLSDEIEGDESFGDVEDRDDLGGGVGLSRTLSSHTSLNLSYTVRAFDLEVSGESLTHLFGGGLTHQLGEQLSVSFQIGVFYRDEVNQSLNPDDVITEESDVGFFGGFSLTKTLANYVLGLSASHQPSAGDILVGTSTNTEVGLSLSPLSTYRWYWALSLRFGYRDPDITDQNPLQSSDLNGSVGRSLGRKVSVSLNSSLLYQIESGASELDISTWRTTLALGFRPFARPSTGGVGSAR